MALNRLPIASPNGEVARVLLAFLATAGLFYVNIMPALVDGLIEGLGFSNRDAGLVGSANVYGAAVGAFTAVFIVKRVNWRMAAVVLLVGLITVDLLSMLLTSAPALIGTRFIHGCIGGLLVGIGFAVISRTTEVDRTFGYLLTIQFGLGGLGLIYLPPLVPAFGTKALFLSLISFSVVTLLMLPFLSDYPARVQETDTDGRKGNRGLIALALLATFLFQAANMGIYAYAIGIGKYAMLDIDFVTNALGIAAWVAIVGSVLVILMSTRFGRMWPVGIAILLTAVSIWLLHFSDVKPGGWETSIYWWSNVLWGITWAFVISYLLGMCSEFDTTGQMAAMGGFASKMGLASGPAVAALLVGENNYGLLINVSVFALLACLAVMILPAATLDRK
ncbi:MAG: MFS transporter [Gammaproteobacteria bacterium]|nr:MFS transporter [Gammaproteobacteria bacterium]